MITRIFIHGLESGNQGTKSVFFREKYPDMVIPNFTGALEKRMERLEAVLSDRSDIILVGSSFGGLMATLFAMKDESRVIRMILLAPAIHMMGHVRHKADVISVPVWVFHGKNDEIIPLAKVKSVSNETFLNLSFHEVDDDHFLHETFMGIDWDGLLDN